MMMMMKWSLRWMIMMSAQIKKRRDNYELGNWEHEGAQNANNKGLGWQAKKTRSLGMRLHTKKKKKRKL